MCSIKRVIEFGILTGGERDGLEPFPPGIRDVDLIVPVVLVLGAVAHVVGIPDEVLEVLILESVEYVEEIIAWRQTVLGVLIGEVLHELGVLLHHGPQLLDAYLIVGRHSHGLDFTESHEQLLIRQY